MPGESELIPCGNEGGDWVASPRLVPAGNAQDYRDVGPRQIRGMLPCRHHRIFRASNQGEATDLVGMLPRGHALTKS